MQIVDTIERLLNAAGHPDIERTERYGPDLHNLVIVYKPNAKAFLSPVTAKATPAELPAELPEYKFRVHYALRLIYDLLEAVQPPGWQWRTVGLDGVALTPCGLEVRAGTTSAVLRVIGGSPTIQDTKPADWAGWQIPVDKVRAAL